MTADIVVGISGSQRRTETGNNAVNWKLLFSGVAGALAARGGGKI